MTIKQDKNLAVIANRARKNISDVAYILTQGLLNAGLIKDDEEYYGVALKDRVDGETPVFTIVDIIKQTGIETVVDTDYDAFCECIIMGDGDCPECGGEMELWDCRGHEISSGNRDLPPNYVTEWEEWCCPYCGHTIEKDFTPDYDD